VQGSQSGTLVDTSRLTSESYNTQRMTPRASAPVKSVLGSRPNRLHTSSSLAILVPESNQVNETKIAVRSA